LPIDRLHKSSYTPVNPLTKPFSWGAARQRVLNATVQAIPTVTCLSPDMPCPGKTTIKHKKRDWP
ncbi:MAG: hypothetical protein ACKVIH_01420, partial [Burkholderiales bacterium]